MFYRLKYVLQKKTKVGTLNPSLSTGGPGQRGPSHQRRIWLSAFGAVERRKAPLVESSWLSLPG